MKTSKNKALLVGVSIALGLGGLSSAQVTGERLFTNTQPKVSRQQAEMKASKAYPAVKIKDVEIERVTPAEMKQMYRDMAAGKEKEKLKIFQCGFILPET